MELTFKQYNTIRLIVVMILAMIIGNMIVLKNFFIPIILLVISSLLLIYLRKNVKGVIADERDYAMGGKAAFLAMQVYSWVAVAGMFLFWAFSDINPFYKPIAMTLAFSTCILMLLYSVIFRYYNKINLTDKKLIYSVFVLALFLAIFLVFSLRLFSGEDNWICQNGQWVEHGHPSFPAPTTNCD